MIDVQGTLNRRRFIAAGGSAAAAAALVGDGILAAPASQKGGPTTLLQQANLPTAREETVVMEQDAVNVWDSFNPFIPNGEAYAYGIALFAREYLFYTNFLTGEVTPWIGKEYSYNDDFTQCTLTLNPAVAWSDGEPYTADDIVFSQQLLLDNPQLNGGAAATRDIAGVEAVDAHTVRWSLNYSNPRFHYRFLCGVISDGVKVVPKHIWEGEDAGTFKFNPPVQTGPYVLKEASSTKLHYLWEKNPNYWNAAELDPEPKFVLVRQAGEIDASVQEFTAGNVDHSSRIRSDYLNQMVIESSYDKTSSFIFQDPCPRGFHFNVDSPTGLFATPEGRWAMSYLIDRELIATTIWQPPSRPATYPWADYEGWKKWAPDDVMSQFDLSYNVDKANELLDQIGATERDGDGIRLLEGKPLKLTMISPRETTHPEFQIGVALATSAKDAGIDIEVKSLPGSAYDDAHGLGDFDIACAWLCGMEFDPLNLYSPYHSENHVPVGERTNRGNEVRLQSPELDKLIDEMKSVDPEDEANQPIFDEALTVFMTELPSVASIQTMYPMLFNTAVWEGWPTEDNPYTIPADWWGQFLFVLGNLKKAGGE